MYKLVADHRDGKFCLAAKVRNEELLAHIQRLWRTAEWGKHSDRRYWRYARDILRRYRGRLLTLKEAMDETVKHPLLQDDQKLKVLRQL